MGLLEKLNGRQKIAAEKKAATEISPSEKNPPPTELCPACGNGGYWLDSYGTWHCGGCEFPPTMSLMGGFHQVEPARPAGSEPGASDLVEWIEADGTRVIADTRFLGRKDRLVGPEWGETWEQFLARRRKPKETPPTAAAPKKRRYATQSSRNRR